MSIIESLEIKNKLYDLCLKNYQYFIDGDDINSKEEIEWIIDDFINNICHGNKVTFIKQPNDQFMKSFYELLDNYIV